MQPRLRCIFIMLFTFNACADVVANDSGQIISDSLSSNWKYEIQTYYYILPNENNNATLIGYADNKALHLEGRYNYENLQTGSLFIGYKLEAGKKLILGATPLIGVVVGKTRGIAPGLEITLDWKMIDFYSESEYVIEYEARDNSYFYNWTELAITPIRKFRTGISGSRTRLYKAALEIKKGIFTEYSFRKVTAGIHYFNPFSNTYFIISTLGISL
jgi:hypothetical protein